MLYNVSSPQFLFAAAGSVCLSLLILIVAYGKKLLSHLGLSPNHAIAQTSSQGLANAWPSQEAFPPLIDKPADHPLEQTGIFQPSEDEEDFEITEEEGPTTLIKEADRVVAEIQDVVDEISSRPANPDEVRSKIRAVVSEYNIFQETEYFDAINSFISITVERDCALSLSEEDLHSLWHANAA